MFGIRDIWVKQLTGIGIFGGLILGIWDGKGAQSRFAHIEKFSLNFSNLSFVIRVYLLHP